jgi:hypothetical protein
MDHIKILKRAWQIVWSYRALWIFGILVALTTVSWEASVLHRDYDQSAIDDGGDLYFNNNSQSLMIPDFVLSSKERGAVMIFNYREQSDRGTYQPGDLILDYNSPGNITLGFMAESKEGQATLKRLRVPPEVITTGLAILLGILIVIVLCIIGGQIVRYVSEAALIRMVDERERTGAIYTIRQGFRMGWSRTAWRLFLINLSIDLAAAVSFLLLFALTLSPLLLWTTKNAVAGVVGTVATGGLFFLVLGLAILVGVLLSPFKQLMRRACAIEGLGVKDSIQQGYLVVRRNLKDVGLMWLIMVGVRFVRLVTIAPVVILLIVAGVVFGAASAALAAGLTALVVEQVAPIILAGLVGVPVFLAVVVTIPAILGGLVEVFLSSIWTMTYRQLRDLERVEPSLAPLPPVDSGKGSTELLPAEA